MEQKENQTAQVLKVRVWRGKGSAGAFHDYEVPRAQSQTVLDVVTHIQQHSEPTLAYRFACRVGMCGSCAMMVNGIPRWTCRSHVKNVAVEGALEIAPLRNLPVIKDLATDMSVFFEKWTQAKGYFEPSASRTDALPAIAPESPQRVKVDEAIECINCAICYAACDTVSHNDTYLGPAALNRAWTLQNDARDAGKTARLHAISGEGGCTNCHAHQSCMTYCPNELNPTRSIAGLKRATVAAFIRREL
ncbi:MAG: 2Fe-2S iron-sulfur cluster-binding protein [Pseudomonadota bacterium]